MSRGKDRFIVQTGGFRFGETQAAFRRRQDEIAKLRERVYSGVASPEDVEQLSQLIGHDEDIENFE